MPPEAGKFLPNWQNSASWVKIRFLVHCCYCFCCCFSHPCHSLSMILNHLHCLLYLYIDSTCRLTWWNLNLHRSFLLCIFQSLWIPNFSPMVFLPIIIPFLFICCHLCPLSCVSPFCTLTLPFWTIPISWPCLSLFFIWCCWCFLCVIWIIIHFNHYYVCPFI